MEPLYRLSITPDSGDSAEIVAQISDQLDEIGDEQDWPPKLLYLVNLSVEEFGLNALTHGLKNGLEEFEVTIMSDSEDLLIELSDDGGPFDPLNDVADPDLTTSLDSREVGGLGIYLIKKMVDRMDYRREGGKNHLRLVLRRN